MPAFVSGFKNIINNFASIEKKPILLIGIGMHIEPMGTTHQGIKSGKGDYSQPQFFDRHASDIRTLVEMVNTHNGKVTIQAQSPFTEVAISRKDNILKDLSAAGNEIALHFHEDAHLGKNSERQPVERWCSVMQEEIDLVKKSSGVSAIQYWSGGNLYPEIFQAAECAGLSVNSDWKNPRTQSTDASLIGVHPWHPAGGTDGNDFSMISKHDPSGPVIFLPEGKYDQVNFASMRRSEESGGDREYFQYLEKSLKESLAAAEAGKVNVFHFTVHPGEFRGTPAHPFEVVEDFLTNVVDPLVESGDIKWATFSEMRDSVIDWETFNPGLDMRK
jgi:hypothetical protein